MRLLKVAGTVCLLTLSLSSAAQAAAAKPKAAAPKKAAAAESKPAAAAEKTAEKPAEKAAEKPAPAKEAAAPEAKAEKPAETKAEKPVEAPASAETAPASAAADSAAKPAETAPAEPAAAATTEAPASKPEESAAAEASVKVGTGDTSRDSATSSAPGAAGDRGPSPLEARLYAGMLSRQFTYSDNQSRNRDFDGTGPIFGVRVAVFPAAFSMTGIPAHLGIVGGYSRELAPETAAEPGIPALTTESQEWYVGVKGRMPVREHELGLELRFLGHDYKLAGDDGADTRPCAWNSSAGADGIALDRGLPIGVSCFFPDVAYSAIEPQAEARFNFGPLLVGAHAGVRILLSTGELEDPWWFANAAGAGLDLGVLGGFRVIDGLHVMVGANLRQYGFDFNPLAPGRSTGRAPGPVAGGAIDRYVSGWLGLNYALAGKPL